MERIGRQAVDRTAKDIIIIAKYYERIGEESRGLLY